MSQRPEYALIGSEGTNIVTKYKGTVTGIQYNLGSSTQVSIQKPVGKDGKIPDALLFDLHRCTFAKKLAKTKLPKVEDFDVWLGDAVEDIVTGFEGVVIAIHCGINGCVELVAVTRVDKEMKSRVHAQNHKRFKINKKAAIEIGDSVVEGKSEPAGSSFIKAVTQRSA